MSISAVKFNKDDQPEFYRTLHKRVNNYFKENNISKHANGYMVFKTVFMLSLYFLPLIAMLTGLVTTFWSVFAMWILMGLGMSGIGFSVMHDANHGAYSSNTKINDALGFVLNFVGGYHINWRIQHNVLHHSYTNVHGHDEDIEHEIFRFTPDEPANKRYRFQAFYAPFMYGLMTLFWVVYKDFKQIIGYDKRGLLKAQGLTLRSAMIQVILYKVLYVTLTLVLPLLLIDLPWTQILVGFLFMHFMCGLFLAFVFQPAHVIEDTEFFTTDEHGSVENSWAIHQLRTTVNFANESRLFSWFIGGLNYQVEHHLFPHICHIHYRKLSPIVRSTAQEYGIPYHEYATFWGALKSHFSLLHALGTGSYDRAKAA
jgi:linoleoyl-CoA desaturase